MKKRQQETSEAMQRLTAAKVRRTAEAPDVAVAEATAAKPKVCIIERASTHSPRNGQTHAGTQVLFQKPKATARPTSTAAARASRTAPAAAPAPAAPVPAVEVAKPIEPAVAAPAAPVPKSNKYAHVKSKVAELVKPAAAAASQPAAPAPAVVAPPAAATAVTPSKALFKWVVRSRRTCAADAQHHRACVQGQGGGPQVHDSRAQDSEPPLTAQVSTHQPAHGPAA